MKTLALFKREVMNYNPSAYLLWIICMACGCFAYLNAPPFMLDISHTLGGVVSFLRKTGELIWGIFSASIFGFVAVIVTKTAGKWWEDSGVKLYEKYFSKKKRP